MARKLIVLGSAIAAMLMIAWALRPAGAEAPGVRPVDRSAGSNSSLHFRGVAIQLQTSYRATETYIPMIQQIADLGADTVLLCTNGLMEHAKSQSIFIDARKTPAPEDLRKIIRAARAAHLKVVVMPIVLLTNPRGSEWRGAIDPPSWEEWWRQYREFVLHFADIANEAGADVFMVGSELVTTEKYTAQWVRIIEAVRERFRGKLGYSANWDHYKPVQFWDKLDLIGMTSYYTLADHRNPSVDEIAGRWRPIYDELAAWQQQVGKPVVLTEVGWCSQEGAAMAPWNYYANQKATPGGHEEQRRLYEAFLRVWKDCPWLSGVIWWEWTPDAGGAGDFGYTPRNKPSEQVLRQWFAHEREHDSQTAAGTEMHDAPPTP